MENTVVTDGLTLEMLGQEEVVPADLPDWVYVLSLRLAEKVNGHSYHRDGACVQCVGYAANGIAYYRMYGLTRGQKVVVERVKGVRVVSA